MSINYFIGLLGGLAIFLYGMEMMSNGLELVAGDKLRVVIEKMTSNFFKAILVGTFVTAIIQSSSATTVMVVGFVNAGLMNIYQAIGIIMGANIGTTITGQLVALNISAMAPIIAFVGFCLHSFASDKKKASLGKAIMGLGFLFMGMELMSQAMEPLRDYPGFVTLMTKFENPLLGVLAGTIITAIIQSSSAALGILQAIANQGVIPLRSSMYIVFGFNIGTCITSVLSSLGSSKNAKRTALAHVLFNIIGTVIFIILSVFIPIDKIVLSFSRDLPAAQIANLHTIFNVATTILLLPFSKKLAELSVRLIPGKDKELEEMSLQYINKNVNKDAHATFTDVRAEINRLLAIVNTNYRESIEILVNFDKDRYEEIFHREKTINHLNKEISAFIIDSLSLPMDEETSSNFVSYMRISRNLERVGDHSKNIADAAKVKSEENLEFTDTAYDDLKTLNDNINQIFDATLEDLSKDKRVKITKSLYQKVQKYITEFRYDHMLRMRDRTCDPESGLIYEKTLTAMERISSYLSNSAKLSI
ncbi:MAG: Na/Pi cotransporter family protein [Anaerococcus sp.]|uniref:Na/Pi cotransporter family protein n=1 Tax=Anaerococcus sp. TaxID=1872515 RepID=UPI0029083590|nr:Na/Pi cotransporter family protein [Anaerococcus sp.]MDU7411835.1 Na/Pi cotransporter family protein [Anaerococcus sp.]